MRIDDRNPVASLLRNVTGNANTATGAQPVPKNGGSDSSGPADGIQLSDRGRISEGLQAAESARAARVQQLRAIYGKGQNPVSAQEVSAAVINEHLAGL